MTWLTERVAAWEITDIAEARKEQQYSWIMDDSFVHTSRYSAKGVGPAGGLGHSFKNYESIRIGYWFTSRGWWGDSIFHFFQANTIEPDPYTHERESWRITMDWDSHAIDVEEYDTFSGTYLSFATVLDPRPLIGGLYDWKHISLYYVPSTGVVKFWSNGELMIDYTLAFAKESNIIYVAASGYGGNSAGYTWVDDLYFDGSTSIESASIPPARRYYSADPDGAGNYTQWTPNSGSNYQTVDDIGPPDDDSTYVSTGSNGTIDTYTFSDLLNLYPEITVDGVVVQAFCRMSPVEGVGGLVTRTRLSGVDDQSDAMRIRGEKSYEHLSVEYFHDWCVINGWFPTDPSGSAWTETSFNNAEFGIESADVI